jgi:hypothetical protein
MGMTKQKNQDNNDQKLGFNRGKLIERLREQSNVLKCEHDQTPFSVIGRLLLHSLRSALRGGFLNNGRSWVSSTTAASLRPLTALRLRAQQIARRYSPSSGGSSSYMGPPSVKKQAMA